MNHKSTVLVMAMYILGLMFAEPAFANSTQHTSPPNPSPVGKRSPAGLFSVNNISFFTGEYQSAIPIPLPPAVGAVPKVSLTYSSRALSETMGHGWDIAGIDVIKRDLAFGMPLYTGDENNCDDDERLKFNIGGSSGRLRFVSVITTNTDICLYRPELEDGAFLKFYYHVAGGKNHWEVADINGNTWVLGLGGEARDYSGSNVFAWYVVKIKDIFGNYIHYTYVKENGIVYPAKIEYDRGFSLTGYPKVEFTWSEGGLTCEAGVEECHDDYPVSYIKGWRTEKKKRLTKITVTGYDENNTSQFREYNLSYSGTKHYSSSQYMSDSLDHMGGPQLTTFAPQDSSLFTPFPKTTFEYVDSQEHYTYSPPSLSYSGSDAWKQSITAAQSVVTYKAVPKSPSSPYEETHSINRIKHKLVDMDGDGVLDRLFIDGDGAWYFHRNLGDNAFSGATPISLPSGPHTDALDYMKNISKTKWALQNPGTPFEDLWYQEWTERIDRTYQVVQDISGDGRADIIYLGIVPGQVYSAIYVCLGAPNGSSWKFNSCIQNEKLPYEALRYTTTRFNWDNWDLDTTDSGGDKYPPVNGPVEQRTTEDLIDMNGDGLLDYVYVWDSKFFIYINKGGGYFAKNEEFYNVNAPSCNELTILGKSPTTDPCISAAKGKFESPDSVKISITTCGTTALIDLNGDGLLDLMKNTPKLSSGPHDYCQPANATSFKYYPGQLAGFDTVNSSTYDLTGTPVLYSGPAGSSATKHTEDGLFIDMNGDRLADLVEWHFFFGYDVDLRVRFNTGHTFLPPAAFAITDRRSDWFIDEAITLNEDNLDAQGNGWVYLRRALLDLNGDGFVDLLDIRPSGSSHIWDIYQHQNIQPIGRMKRLTSESGNRTEITYSAINTVPFPTWFASSIKYKDLVATPSYTLFFHPYGGGYDEIKREFTGFSQTKIDNSKTEVNYFFHNSTEPAEAFKRGRIYKMQSFDLGEIAPILQQETLYTYTKDSFDGGKREWAKLNVVTDKNYVASPTFAQTKKYTYWTSAENQQRHDLGLIKELIYNQGDADERRDVYDYVIREDSGKPYKTVVRISNIKRKEVGGLNTLAETAYFYDGQCAGGGLSHGQLCKTSVWRGTGESPAWSDTTYEYDAAHRLTRVHYPDGEVTVYQHFGNRPFPAVIKSTTGTGTDIITYRSNYHGLTGQPGKVCGPAYKNDPQDDLCTETVYDWYGRVKEVRTTVTDSKSTKSYGPAYVTTGAWDHLGKEWVAKVPAHGSYIKVTMTPSSGDPDL